tara:strand:- start:37 stop:315 length:279 start_codon:yes stop_codon:yes gene_type:complete
MLSTTIGFIINIGIYILIIYCLHCLWEFVKNNYSVKKTKDLITMQTNKYKEIIDTIQNTTIPKNTEEISDINVEKLNNELDTFIDAQFENNI